MKRPTVACGLCGKKTWAAGGFCSRCVHHARHNGEVHPQLGLYGGRWVGRRGIQVWVKGDAA